jgi:hypothetical protein
VGYGRVQWSVECAERGVRAQQEDAAEGRSGRKPLKNKTICKVSKILANTSRNIIL